MKVIKKFESFEMNTELMDRASEIIGKELDNKNAVQEITDFIERNISNDSMVDIIDELTTIKRKLKH